MLSRQNIWNSRQIAADKEEKLANQGEVQGAVLREGISSIYVSLSNKWKPCHWAINNRLRNLRMALENYFSFHWNCKQLLTGARNGMSNCEIYFPRFFETVHTILKSTFLSTVLRSICKDYCKKNGVLEISTKIFWLDCLSTFNSSQKLRNSGSALLFIVFRCYLSFQFY